MTRKIFILLFILIIGFSIVSAQETKEQLSKENPLKIVLNFGEGTIKCLVSTGDGACKIIFGGGQSILEGITAVALAPADFISEQILYNKLKTQFGPAFPLIENLYDYNVWPLIKLGKTAYFKGLADYNGDSDKAIKYVKGVLAQEVANKFIEKTEMNKLLLSSDLSIDEIVENFGTLLLNMRLNSFEVLKTAESSLGLFKTKSRLNRDKEPVYTTAITGLKLSKEMLMTFANRPDIKLKGTLVKNIESLFIGMGNAVILNAIAEIENGLTNQALLVDTLDRIETTTWIRVRNELKEKFNSGDISDALVYTVNIEMELKSSSPNQDYINREVHSFAKEILKASLFKSVVRETKIPGFGDNGEAMTIAEVIGEKNVLELRRAGYAELDKVLPRGLVPKSTEVNLERPLKKILLTFLALYVDKQFEETWCVEDCGEDSLLFEYLSISDEDSSYIRRTKYRPMMSVDKMYGLYKKNEKFQAIIDESVKFLILWNAEDEKTNEFITEKKILENKKSNYEEEYNSLKDSLGEHDGSVLKRVGELETQIESLRIEIGKIQAKIDKSKAKVEEYGEKWAKPLNKLKSKWWKLWFYWNSEGKYIDFRQGW